MTRGVQRQWPPPALLRELPERGRQRLDAELSTTDRQMRGFGYDRFLQVSNNPNPTFRKHIHNQLWWLAKGAAQQGTWEDARKVLEGEKYVEVGRRWLYGGVRGMAPSLGGGLWDFTQAALAEAPDDAARAALKRGIKDPTTRGRPVKLGFLTWLTEMVGDMGSEADWSRMTEDQRIRYAYRRGLANLAMNLADGDQARARRIYPFLSYEADQQFNWDQQTVRFPGSDQAKIWQGRGSEPASEAPKRELTRTMTGNLELPASVLSSGSSRRGPTVEPPVDPVSQERVQHPSHRVVEATEPLTIRYQAQAGSPGRGGDARQQTPLIRPTSQGRTMRYSRDAGTPRSSSTPSHTMPKPAGINHQPNTLERLDRALRTTPPTRQPASNPFMSTGELLGQVTQRLERERASREAIERMRRSIEQGPITSSERQYPHGPEALNRALNRSSSRTPPATRPFASVNERLEQLSKRRAAEEQTRAALQRMQQAIDQGSMGSMSHVHARPIPSTADIHRRDQLAARQYNRVLGPDQDPLRSAAKRLMRPYR